MAASEVPVSLSRWSRDVLRAFSVAWPFLLRAKERMKYSADKLQRHVHFDSGKWVLVHCSHWNPVGGLKKLEPVWIGPFEVVCMFSPVSALVGFTSHLNCHPSVHVSRLKKFIGIPPRSMESTSEYVDIERILGHRKKGKLTEFLIKHCGCPESENEWVQESDIAAPAKIKAYRGQCLLEGG